MRIGAENKNQVRWMIALLAIALLVGIYEFADFGGTSSAAAPAPATTVPPQKKTSLAQAPDNNLDPRLRTDILAASQSKKYEAGGRNIFKMEEAPVISKLVAPARKEDTVPAPPTPTPTPPPPPINLKFYGFATSKPSEPKKIFLADESEVFVARQGDIVERKYKVVQINNTSVVIEDVLNNNRQPIPLTAK
ncbi:MAG TPA: hypothetical protein VFB79_19015 [Candidatus Angelobacter sp.]|nr:hypothetical protein [Candidatus Angelobacter sp.]